MRNNNIFIIIFFILFGFILHSEEYYSETFGYFIDIPEEWSILDSSNPEIVSFTDPLKSAVIQVFVFKKDKAFISAQHIYDHVKKQLNAEGMKDPFKYSNYDAILADLTFTNGKYNVRGYFVFINTNDNDYAIFSFAPLESYEKYHDYLLSGLNSFSIDKENKITPGPISQYYYPYKEKIIKSVGQVIGNKKITINIDEKEIEATQVLIDREARILASYWNSNKKIKAWLRYYKMLYKDNYTRLNPICDSINQQLNINVQSKEETSKIILKWIQGYRYVKNTTFSDILSPLQVLKSSSGDCDSRSLLYILILHHFKIDAVLLVSEKYMHSAVGVNINLNGAKIQYNNNDYLYAELTDKVEIGLIPQKMAEISNWILMQLDN